MSGFQIPGLGQAKPNESLPPLPQEAAVATAPPGAETDEPMGDAQPEATKAQADAIDAPTTTIAEDKPSTTENATNVTTQAPEAADAMAVDRPESPPSLTDAMEAALNGLGQAEVAALAAQPQEPQVEVSQQGQAQQPLQERQPPLENDQGENPEWEVDSSPYESSSDSSSDDSSDDDSENEGYELMGVEETARLLMEAEGGSDDEGERGRGSSTAQVRTKNEIAEEIIPRPDITITPEMKVQELGVVESAVENIILIRAFTPGEYQVLDTGSVLCNENRVVIGAVAETIGKVLQPMYVVYFNSPEELKELGIEAGTKIFYPTDHVSFVFTEPLKNLKGSDASNLHDEEVGDEEMEFSDDEKEAEYKRSLKQKKKDKWKNSNGKGGKEPHPLRQEVRPDGGLNYDEGGEDDGPYKPLARPPGYGEGPVSTESYDTLPPRPSFQQGRRGDFRGRGRGRGSGRGGRGGHGQSREGYSLPPQGHSQPPAHHAAPAGAWAGFAPPPPPQGQAPPPALPNFGFQIPPWPQQPSQGGPASLPVPPPPPPGWPAQGQAQGQAQAPNSAYMNPAFLAALMSQMQQANQNGQPQWPGQQPPNGGHGH
ncbi:H/ACA ribonucleoprotein complex non-core subunit NAF1 [Paramyrothecium foliicola]|nr:H/ACA ribonucleoprotein complex non-core subunit NAF1 [Paramyrothecium foliicola]